MTLIARTTFITILLGVLIIFVDASPAAACSCAGTQAQVAELADAVFAGTVVEADSDPSDNRYLFAVDHTHRRRRHASVAHLRGHRRCRGRHGCAARFGEPKAATAHRRLMLCQASFVLSSNGTSGTAAATIH